MYIWISFKSFNSEIFTKLLLVGELPTNDGSCVNPTKEHSKFARRNDLLQTPTIFFDNGYFFKGQPTTKQIVDVLGGAGVRPD